MDESEDPIELERKIAQANRIFSRITDQTTYERLRAWVEELRQRLGQRLAARRMREEIRARAHELWEQNGRPSGRVSRIIRHFRAPATSVFARERFFVACLSGSLRRASRPVWWAAKALQSMRA